MKASCQEPAERNLTLAVSEAEVVALVKFHCAQAKAITKRFGKAALELRASSLLPSGRQLEKLAVVARAQQEAHIARAKGLASLLKSKIKP